MRSFAILALVACLGGCGAAIDAPFASEEVVREKAYRHPGAPTISVITMVNNASGGGAHSALLISASQRVIFDPAGSFQNAIVPERHDVLFGISPRVLAAYKSAHARSAYHVVTQTMTVTPEQAELALRLAQENGPVPAALCTQATSGLLRQIPGFEGIKATLFPANLMRQIEARSGVETDRYFEDDAGGILDGVAKVDL